MSEWKINGQDLRSAGVVAGRLRRRNVLGDDFSFSVPLSQAGRGFSFGGRVELTRGGERVFVGTLVRPTVQTLAEGEAVVYQALGPQRALEETVFGRSARSIRSSTVTLFSPAQGKVSVATALDEILKWGSQGDFTWSIAAPDVFPPMVEMEARSCLEALREVTSWIPDLAVRWDYSASVPALSILPLASTPHHSFNAGDRPLQSVAYGPAKEFDLEGVVAAYMDSADAGAPMIPPVRVDAYPAGAVIGGRGVLVLPLAATDMVAGVDVARRFFEAAQRLEWGASVMLADQLPRAGDGINIDGLQLYAHTVTTDVFTDATRVDCGLPPHLGVREMLDLAAPFRRASSRSSPETLDGPAHPFAPFLVKQNGIYRLRFAPGTIRGYNQDIVPRWNGTKLDAAVPPSVEFYPGFRQEFWIRVVFMPDAQEFDLSYIDTNDEPVAVTWWRFVSSGTVRSAEVVTTEGPPVLPYCPNDGKFKTPGIYYFKLATPTNRETLRRDRVDFEPNAMIGGSFGLIFHPPKTLQRYA